VSVHRLLLVGATAFVLNSCNTPSSPTRHLLRTGEDARVYNAMTGRYEWPEEPAAPRSSRTTARESQEAAPAQPSTAHERIYSPQNGRFESPR